MSIPKTQIGYGFELGNRKIVKYDSIPVPEPKESEILLKIEAAGLCQSDLHILIAQDKKYPKFIMGHEIAGQIAKTGKELQNDPRYQPGKRYSMLISNSCGTCKYCRQGLDTICSNINGYGISTDGGFQEYLLVKNLNTLIPIPDGVSYEQAAVSTDSVLTPYHAIKKVRQYLDANTKVLLIGLGGLGLNALQILKSHGCNVVACDVKPELEKQALEYGAAEFHTDITKSSHAPETFDVCFDFCGLSATFQLCQKYIANNGKLVMVGLGNYKLPLFNYELARREVTIFMNYGGNGGEQHECLKYVEKGKVSPLITVDSLSKLPEYLDKLAKGKVEGRVVFRPSKL